MSQVTWATINVGIALNRLRRLQIVAGVRNAHLLVVISTEPNCCFYVGETLVALDQVVRQLKVKPLHDLLARLNHEARVLLSRETNVFLNELIAADVVVLVLADVAQCIDDVSCCSLTLQEVFEGDSEHHAAGSTVDVWGDLRLVSGEEAGAALVLVEDGLCCFGGLLAALFLLRQHCAI